MIEILSAFLGSLGFAILFGTKKSYWLLVSLDGMFSWIVFLALSSCMSDFFAYVLSATFCSLYAHIAARIVKAPTTCLLMPATVPMIPGGSLYYTLFYAMQGEWNAFLSSMLMTGKIIFAMAIGFAVVTMVFRNYEHRLRGAA